jgi:2-polyprenyl-6-methoxyphenol hydroxylase-like FAD-dependent oxidoreductase
LCAGPIENAGERLFDLVIGADGLHSSVRKLAFGSEDRFERQLGYVVAAFEVRGYRPRDEDVYEIHSGPGRMLGRFALHDDRTLFLFVFAADVDPSPMRLLRAKTLLLLIWGELELATEFNAASFGTLTVAAWPLLEGSRLVKPRYSRVAHAEGPSDLNQRLP